MVVWTFQSDGEKMQLCEVIEVLANLFLVIPLQYIPTTNHHMDHLKLSAPCQFRLNKTGKKVFKIPEFHVFVLRGSLPMTQK